MSPNLRPSLSLGAWVLPGGLQGSGRAPGAQALQKHSPGVPRDPQETRLPQPFGNSGGLHDPSSQQRQGMQGFLCPLHKRRN